MSYVFRNNSNKSKLIVFKKNTRADKDWRMHAATYHSAPHKELTPWPVVCMRTIPLIQELKDISSCSMWVWNLVSHPKG